jgi:hypothetical protein
MLLAKIEDERQAVKVRISRDPDPQDPRDATCLGHLVHWHQRLRLASDAIHVSDIHEAGRIVDDKSAVAVLTIYICQHGDVQLSTDPFNDPWDSGIVGIYYTALEDINTLGVSLDQVDRILRAEIEALNHWLNGDVYGVRIFDQDGEEMDACWGFFGTDWDTNGLKDFLPEHLRDHTKWEFE